MPPTAILLLTDGQTTDGEALAKAAEFARAKGVPLYTIGLGSPEPSRDLELADLLVDDVVFVDDQVRFEAKLLGRGFGGEEVTVHLKRRPAGEKDPKAAQELDQLRVEVPPDGQARRIEIGHQPEGDGRDTSTSLEVDSRPRELQAENNRIERTVNVREEKLKVLLVEGEPRYEYRYLKTFLESDKTIDLRVVLQSSDPEYSEQDRSALPTFPTSTEGPDGLFSYDVVLFGDVDISSLLSATQMQNLVEFVTEKGGGLLFIAGENFNPLSYRGTPLEPLLPIQLAEARDPAMVGNGVAGFRPALTVEGRNHPIFRFGDDEATSAQIWQNLPELYWFLEAPRKQPAAFVLADAPEPDRLRRPLADPALPVRRRGQGRCSRRSTTPGAGGSARATPVLRPVLDPDDPVPGPVEAARADAGGDHRPTGGRYQRNQPIRVQVRFPNPGLAPASGEVTVQVAREGQGPRKLTLKAAPTARNVFEGALPQAAEGEYEVRLLPPPVLEGRLPTTTFRVEAPAGEFEQIRMNEPELIRAAANAQGKFYQPTVAPAVLLKDLPPPLKVPLDTDPPIPLWNTPAVLRIVPGDPDRGMGFAETQANGIITFVKRR